MKYKVNDVVYHADEWHPECTGHKVLEVKESAGIWKMPRYKRDASKQEIQSGAAKSGFVWMMEWMLR